MCLFHHQTLPEQAGVAEVGSCCDADTATINISAKASQGGSFPLLAIDSDSGYYLSHLSNEILTLLKSMAKLSFSRAKILPKFIADFTAVTKSDILLPNS